MMEDKLIIKCHSTLEGEKEMREGVRGEGKGFRLNRPHLLGR